MKQLKKYIIPFIVLGMSIYGCENEKIAPIDTSMLPDEISFSEHITPIFSARCTNCHGGQTPPDLTATEAFLNITAGGYINIQNPANSEFYKIITTGNMKQHATDLDRAYILKWIEEGALDN